MLSQETQQHIIEFLLGHKNLDGFELWELVLFAFGFLFWTLAYLHIVIDGRRDAVNEMPMLAAAGNIAWEILWTFVLKSDLGFLFAFSLNWNTITHSWAPAPDWVASGSAVGKLIQ